MMMSAYTSDDLLTEILETLIDALHDDYAVDSPAIDCAIREIYSEVEQGNDERAMALLDAMPVIEGFPAAMLWGFLSMKQDLKQGAQVLHRPCEKGLADSSIDIGVLL